MLGRIIVKSNRRLVGRPRMCCSETIKVAVQRREVRMERLKKELLRNREELGKLTKLST